MIGGCAAWLDGVNDYVNLGTVGARDFTALPFSVLCWIYPTNVAALQRIISHGVIATSGYTMRIGVTGFLNLTTCSPGNTNTDSVNGALTANLWQHCAAVVGSNGICRLYLNGNELAYAAQPTHAAPVASAGATALGATVGGGAGWMSGAIDEPAFFNVALTQEQIRAYMYASLTASTPGCVSLHHLDDGLSNFLGTNANATIGVVAGTLTNGASWVYDRWAPWVEPRVSSTAAITVNSSTEIQITGTLRRFIPRVTSRVHLAAQWDLLTTTAGAGSIRCLFRENGTALAHEATLNVPAAGPLLRGSHAHLATRDWTKETVYTLDLAARLNDGADAIRAQTQTPHTGYTIVAMPVDGTW